MQNELQVRITGDASSLKREVDGSTTLLRKLGAATADIAHIGTAFTLAGQSIQNALAPVKEFGAAIILGRVEADKLKSSLSFSAGSGKVGAEMDYIRDAADGMGLQLTSAGMAYAKLQAAAAGSAMAGDGARKIFEAIGTASATMGLSADEASGALLAISQMLSKGVVAAEEFRGQLGERIPGAMAIGARAIGVTEREFVKMLDTGQLISADFLPKFAAEMKRTFESGGEGARTMQAELNRLDNAFANLRQSLGEGALGDATKGALSGLASSIKDIGDNMREAGSEGSALYQILVGIGTALAAINGNNTNLSAAGRRATLMQRLEAYSRYYDGAKTGEQKEHAQRLMAGVQRDLLTLSRSKSNNLDADASNADRLALFGIDLKAEYEKGQKQDKDAQDALLKQHADFLAKFSKQLEKEKELREYAARFSGLRASDPDKYQAGIDAINKKFAPKPPEEYDVDAWASHDATKAMRKDEQKLAEMKRRAEQSGRARLAMNQTVDNLNDAYSRSNAQAAEKDMPAAQRNLAEAIRQVEERADAAREALAQKAAALNDDNAALETFRRAVIDVGAAEDAQKDKARALWEQQQRNNELWQYGAGRALQSYQDSLLNVAQSIEQAMSGAFKSMEDALVRFVSTGKLDFKSLADSILADIARIQIRRSIMTPLFGTGKDGDDGMIGSWMKSIFKPSANGNVFSGPGISAYSNQIVSKPTLFPFANGIGLMGEAGAEAIMPLTRRNGVLGVQGGGSTVVVNIVESPGTGKGGTQQRRSSGGVDYLDVFVEKIKSSIAGDIADGRGSIPAAMSSTFGLNRGVGAY